ncbi:hypothetical protein EKO24_017335 [Candidatus Methylobacter oryzae]|uniref:Transposase n=1 Tax=Candidatus Methylobacter oryzae TaxID=2497749 RepID=A0ABY3C705_9GAMM|nr:hypothetical protein [Candidatus Methylobacter oryzae]TRW91336.1 hypothetical protein EKO24_017335 [Candidatus Methylobacter oryzae]
MRFILMPAIKKSLALLVQPQTIKTDRSTEETQRYPKSGFPHKNLHAELPPYAYEPGKKNKWDMDINGSDIRDTAAEHSKSIKIP